MATTVARVRFAVLILLAVAAACSTSRSVRRPVSSRDITQINQSVGDGEVLLTYDDDQRNVVREAAYGLSLTQEDARWFRVSDDPRPSQEAAERRSAPMEAIRTIKFCDGHCRLLGALEGAGFGILVGGLAGFGVLATQFGRDSAGNDRVYAVFVPAFVAYGMLLGGIAGAAISHHTSIEFEPREAR